MRKRLFTLLLTLLMLLAAIPTVRAEGFTDTTGHWGKDYIDRAVELGFFQGVSATTFDPDGLMTRGMFVTVLGRLEGIDHEYWSSSSVPHFFKQDVDESAYYAPYINWAVCNGIVNGMSDVLFAPDAPITREQMAKLVACYVQSMGHSLTVTAGEMPERFTDEGEIADWASESVEFLRLFGIINGLPSEDGSISFQPKNTSTRAQCATVFCRLIEALSRSENPPVQPEGISLSDELVDLPLGGEYSLIATVLPDESRLIWRSSDTSIFTVDENGKVTCRSEGTAIITAYTSNGLFASCTFTCEMDLASADETYEEKCMRVFGEVVDNPKYYYAIYDENGNYVDMDYEKAKADMVTITVDTWDINSKGEKYTRQFTIDVHKNLKDTYIQIFKEIYEGQEQFPVHYLWCYSHSGRSEHTLGTAVDINPNENYYYNPNTGEQVGDYWKPGEDPYSIPLDGEVARIFAKYGFIQGAYWNSAKDYMHFSYFGT